MIKIVVILIFVLIQFKGYSFEFRGVVNDEVGLPIPFVSVFESITNQGVKTNEHGEFVLKFKREGDYKVRFSQVGYGTEVFDISVLEVNSRLTIVLNSIRELKTIEVYGKTQGEEQEEKGFQVDIVKLKNQQNITSDINQILKTTSGISIRESGGLGSDFVLSLNGLSGNQIRYFIDGVPMENFG